MRISLNWINDFVKINRSPKEIAEKITLSLSEVEKIEKAGEDTILEIENKALTHRPDCFSHFGMAREIAALFDLKLNNFLEDLKRTKFRLEKCRKQLKVRILNKNYCKRYTAAVLENIKVEESPQFIKERLLHCGIRPINNVVDITNYVMLAIGQPIHAFDYKKIKDQTILVRTAKTGEGIITLDGIRRNLNQKILVIADSQKPVALAGIMGGQNSAVDKQTTTVIIESANFDPRVTRKSAKMLNLRTEASSRFEKNLHPALTELALVYTISLLQKYAGALLSSEIIDLYPLPEKEREIITTADYLNRLLGLDLTETEIINLLKRLEIKATVKNNKLVVKTAFLRRDLNIPADIAEEVARIYGYDNLPVTLPSGVILPPTENNSLYWEKKTKLFLSALGLNEVSLSSLISQEIIELTGENVTNHLKLLNPMSPDKAYLRRSLLPGLIICARNNYRFLKDFCIFEIGRIFLKTKIDQQPEEVKTLAGLMINKSFFEVKGLLEALFDYWKISFPKVSVLSKPAVFLPKICAKLGDFGYFGEINLKVKNWIGNDQKCIAAFELNFDKIVSLSKKDSFYKPVSLYPAVIEDFSFIFEKKPPLGIILSVIKTVSPQIKEVKILDQFKNSLTFRISFQDPNKSLSSQELKPIREKIIEKLKPYSLTIK